MLPITFHFNESARVRVCFMLCALTFFGVGLSTLYLLAVLHLSSSVGEYTSLVDGYSGDFLMTVLTYLAFVSVLFNVLGCYMSYVAMYPERRAQSQVKMIIMTLAQLLLVAAFAGCSVLCYINADHVQDSFKGGLMKSMRRYRNSIDVKQSFDRLQSDHECCGDFKYTDWFRVSWVPDEFVDISYPDIRDRMRSGSGYKSDDVPFSCCDLAARRPCIREFMHDNRKHFNYDYQKGLTVNANGCREALVNYVRTRLFIAMCIATSICFLLQAIILVLWRYLQTSVTLAIRKGDPTSDSLAYIMSFCLPTDDMTDDKCERPVSTGAAPSAAPSFAISQPPAPSATAQTLQQAAATLAAVGGQPPPAASPPNFSSDAGVVDDLTALCRRLPPLGATPINNSARVDPRPGGTVPSSRSSVVGMTAPYAYGQRTQNFTAPATPQPVT